jgi:hypothetical protein
VHVPLPDALPLSTVEMEPFVLPRKRCDPPKPKTVITSEEAEASCMILEDSKHDRVIVVEADSQGLVRNAIAQFVSYFFPLETLERSAKELVEEVTMIFANDQDNQISAPISGN